MKTQIYILSREKTRIGKSVDKDIWKTHTWKFHVETRKSWNFYFHDLCFWRKYIPAPPVLFRFPCCHTFFLGSSSCKVNSFKFHLLFVRPDQALELRPIRSKI